MLPEAGRSAAEPRMHARAGQVMITDPDDMWAKLLIAAARSLCSRDDARLPCDRVAARPGVVSCSYRTEIQRKRPLDRKREEPQARAWVRKHGCIRYDAALTIGRGRARSSSRKMRIRAPPSWPHECHAGGRFCRFVGHTVGHLILSLLARSCRSKPTRGSTPRTPFARVT